MRKVLSIPPQEFAESEEMRARERAAPEAEFQRVGPPPSDNLDDYRLKYINQDYDQDNRRGDYKRARASLEEYVIVTGLEKHYRSENDLGLEKHGSEPIFLIRKDNPHLESFLTEIRKGYIAEDILELFRGLQSFADYDNELV